MFVSETWSLKHFNMEYKVFSDKHINSTLLSKLCEKLHFALTSHELCLSISNK